MTILKRFISIFLCITLLCSISIPAFAATKPSLTARCPRCNHLNTSYGCDQAFKWTSVSSKSGTYCGACKRITPDDEAHMYLYSSDKYFFLCSSSKCSRLSFNNRKYTILFDNPPSEHYTNGIRDY